MPSRLTALRIRMIAAIVGLGVVMVALLAGVWAVFYGVLLVLDVGIAAELAFAATAATLVPIGYLEYAQLETIEGLADAHPVDRETAPELHETATRVAAQLGVPAPTIAVSDRDAPEALAVGLRPDAVHLVLSLGTIDALDGDQLEAVIAHELAHVGNRDAMVMTAVSLPVVVADGLGSRIDRIENPGWAAVVTVPLAFLSTAVWVVGRTITARFSRARERAADRAAAEAIGSPAALASALRRLDREIDATPDRDLRAASSVSSLSVLPLDPDEPEQIMLGPEGETEPSYWWLRKRRYRIERYLFDTHPPTEERIAALADLERRQ
jgi:heat shock protein HtpX